MTDKFGDKDNFAVEPREKSEVVLKSDCVFEVSGRFHFTIRNKIDRKSYVISLKPKEGAPQGLDIVGVDIR